MQTQQALQHPEIRTQGLPQPVMFWIAQSPAVLYPSFSPLQVRIKQADALLNSLAFIRLRTEPGIDLLIVNNFDHLRIQSIELRDDEQ